MDYDTWAQDSPLEFKKKLMEHFINETINYANSHIQEKQEGMGNADAATLEHLTLRLFKWLSYVEFQQHTLNELQSDKLDRFFQ